MEREQTRPRVDLQTQLEQRRRPWLSPVVCVNRGPESADKIRRITGNLYLQTVKGVACIMFAGRE